MSSRRKTKDCPWYKGLSLTARKSVFKSVYSNMIRAVIFDWGGVLIENPAKDIITWCAKGIGVEPGRFAQSFRDAEPDFQSGRIDEKTFWNRTCAGLGVPPPERAGLWGEALRNAYRPRPALFALVEKLRRTGIKTALLSNTEMPAVDLYHERHEGAFDVVVLSCLEGLRKPGREIYLKTLERLGVAAKDALFIDDRSENAAAAQAIGMATICDGAEQDILTGIARFIPSLSNI